MKPEPTPETAPYWEGARAGELRIQRCSACGRHYFYPRVACRFCSSLDVEWVAVSGRASLVSYVINHRPLPGFEAVSPVIALVELEEGPRLMTNIVGVEPEPANLPLDLRLLVTFEERSGVVLPVFRPEEVDA
jgi:uncharacterized OB-fold protein